MYFFITFRDPNTRNTKTLRWLLVDNPVAKIWAGLVKKQKGIEFKQLSFPSIIDRVKVSKEIKDTVDILNNLGANLPPWEVKQIIDQPKLNALHEAFHKFEDRVENRVDKSKFINRSSEVVELFFSLNRNIHILEGLRHNDVWEERKRIDKYYKHATHSYCVVQFQSGPESKEYFKITDDIRKYFINSRPSNYNTPCLYLGYATIGKNIKHCWADNDIDIVKQNLLSPQEYITPEFCITLNALEVDKDAHKPSPRELKKRQKQEHEIATNDLLAWVSENNLENFVDMTDLKNLYTGEPLLGVMERELSCEELYSLLSQEEYKIVEHGIIEDGSITTYKYPR